MKAGRLLTLIALVLVLPVGGLVSLAYASPPDPSWVHGIYVDADYDDVVSLITFESGTAAPGLLAEVERIPLVAPVSPPSREPFSTLSVLPRQSRAPPALPLPR